MAVGLMFPCSNYFWLFNLLIFSVPDKRYSRITSYALKWISMFLFVLSKVSYVTFKGSIEIGSHKTGGRFIQVQFGRKRINISVTLVSESYALSKKCNM